MENSLKGACCGYSVVVGDGNEHINIYNSNNIDTEKEQLIKEVIKLKAELKEARAYLKIIKQLI